MSKLASELPKYQYFAQDSQMSQSAMTSSIKSPYLKKAMSDLKKNVCTKIEMTKQPFRKYQTVN